MADKKNIKILLEERDSLAEQERKLYLDAVEKINMRSRELLDNNFGTMLVQNIGRDLAGEVVRRYFDMSDYYITVDQLYDRFLHFSYDNDTDIFHTDEGIRKAYYNYTDGINSRTLKSISDTCREAQKQLFTIDRANDPLDSKGKKAYRNLKTTEDGKIFDELTGKEGKSRTIIKNGKEVSVSELQADHIQARESASYNEQFIKKEKVEEIRKFYNSEDNMQMIHGSANSSKGDVRVCEVNGKVEYLNAKNMKTRQKNGENVLDITYKATPQQLAEATIAQWEKETPSGNKLKKLQEEGYLDANGKVKKDVKEKLVENIKNSQNKESLVILKSADYQKISKKAGNETISSVGKILAGQIVYYVMPPMIFETQTILKQKDITLDTFFKELKKAGNRVTKYVQSKMKEIFKNIAGNTFHKFIKSFFDCIIEIVKATAKRIVKVIKDVTLSLINCVKVLAQKESSASQKADSITKILAATVTTVVMEILFEYLETQFHLPDFLMEPLQIIVTILSTNIIMLMLSKLDLFNTKYGFLVSNIENIFEEENERLLSSRNELLQEGRQVFDEQIQEIESEIASIKNSIIELNMYKDEALPYLDKINEVFDMGIDFEEEWMSYLQVV